MTASIYTRINGQIGASCDGVQDTGYHITARAAKDRLLYTVYDMDDPDKTLAVDVPRVEAEAVIAEDWRGALGGIKTSL